MRLFSPPLASFRVQSNQSSSLLARSLAPGSRHMYLSTTGARRHDVVRLRVDLEHVAVSNDGFQPSPLTCTSISRIAGRPATPRAINSRPPNARKVHDDARWVRPIRRFEVIRYPVPRLNTARSQEASAAARGAAARAARRWLARALRRAGPTPPVPSARALASARVPSFGTAVRNLPRPRRAHFTAVAAQSRRRVLGAPPFGAPMPLCASSRPLSSLPSLPALLG